MSFIDYQNVSVQRYLCVYRYVCVRAANDCYVRSGGELLRVCG